MFTFDKNHFYKISFQIKIQIAGHTDNVGSYKANIRLSKNRAQRVTNYLIEKGIEEDRIVAVGYGSSRPIASNETDEGKAENRRVEVVILKD